MAVTDDENAKPNQKESGDDATGNAGRSIPGERGLVLTDSEIHALLNGLKTQYRIRLSPQPDRHQGNLLGFPDEPGAWRVVEPRPGLVTAAERSPFRRGQRLWVREAHALVPVTAYRTSEGVAQVVNPHDPDQACIYRCGWDRSAPHWRSPTQMPRWASRITLCVEDVRIQRVQDISEDDARAEGVRRPRDSDDTWVGREGPGRWITPWPTAREAWADIWDSNHGPGAWKRNEWVAALTFSVKLANIDALETQRLVDRVRALEEALHGVLEWDARRGYPLPYRVRDPIHKALGRSAV